MGLEGILGIIAAIRSLSGIVDGWRQSEGMTKEELVALARQKDKTLGDFIDSELALLDAKPAVAKKTKSK